VVVTVQIAMDTAYWTVFNHITVWGSLIWYFVLQYFYNYVIGGPYVGALSKAMGEASFWFTLVLSIVVLMIPVVAWRFYFADVDPTLSNRVRLKQRLSAIRAHKSQDFLRTPSARRSRRSLRSGYAFSHQEGFGKLITSGKIMRKTVLNFGKLSNSSNNNSNNNSSAGAMSPAIDHHEGGVSNATSNSTGAADNNGGSSMQPSTRQTYNTPGSSRATSNHQTEGREHRSNSRKKLHDPYAITLDPNTDSVTLPNTMS